MTTIIEDHIQFANAYNGLLLVICIAGMVFNMAMLFIFCSKKQIRRSVYTTYMIQIAVTDVIVCVLWLVMAIMNLSTLPTYLQIKEEFHEDVAHPDQALEKNTDDTKSLFIEQRLIYAMYYFYYYNNIFLLAAMSVERCVAVMKSLRCQRYEFNKRFIYAVSGLMWLSALACALPSFVNPSLITENEQTGMMNSDHNLTSYGHTGLLWPTETIINCRKPLKKAKNENRETVTDCCGVKVKDCLDFFEEYGTKHNEFVDDNETFINEDLNEFVGDLDNSSSDYYNNEFLLSPDNLDDFNNSIRSVESYEILLFFTTEFVKADVETDDLQGVCDPKLSYEGKLYQIIVNLVIGFFIPFLAIVISNLSIAAVIRGRARSRLESDNTEEDGTVRLRVSEFFQQFSKGLSRSETESGRVGSPIVRKSLKDHKIKIAPKQLNSNEKNGYAKLDESLKKVADVSLLTQHSQTSYKPSESSISKPREPRLRLSTASTHFRRTSGGSGSSAESFLTDMTSLQTSPSPGLKLTAPQFGPSFEGRVPVQRAYSAEGSTSSSSNQSRPTSARRWSNEIFRTNSTIKEEKNHVPTEKKEEYEMNEPFKDDEKFTSTLPPRFDRNESTQELLGNHVRLSTSKYSNLNQHYTNTRNRAYSVTSRSSPGGTLNSNCGMMRQTIVHKHAVKQMRVSATVLAFVIVFTLCWLPQRIVTMLYISESMIGQNGHFCNVLNSSVRLLSFFCVLLNPIVYAVTQKEIRHLVKDTLNKFCRFCCLRKDRNPNPPMHLPRADNVVTYNKDKNSSGIVIDQFSTDENPRLDRHMRNRELFSRLVQRLGRPGVKVSLSASGVSTHKPSNETIEEEREEDKGPSSKNQSSSNSFKLNNVFSNWDDWKQLTDMNGLKNTQTATQGSN